ncbi:MAG: DUF1848 domain-containing protein [Lachnospiraceae bacterium]|nr:DUF1848 domain-containing protein [Ruminococcus sp.]MCM1275728.1 DUF1848 domain-containing protein [Lachnospiraceae bacterium]
MILSVSRRTDVPAFYADWFYERVREGSVCVRNPMNAHQVSRISLSPEVVDCIVFWSKNPRPMLERLGGLDAYKYYFQYTLNDYGRDVEAHVPSLGERIDAFLRLSERAGKERVIWRYDPIMFNGTYTPETTLKSIENIARQLSGRTEKLVFSLVDNYQSKNSGNLARAGERKLSPEELDGFLTEISEIGKKYKLELATCAEAFDGEKYGIKHNSCIDGALIERIIGAKLNVKRDGQREHCQCVKCDDIGSYDTCPHGCIYCYANFRPQVVSDRIRQYDVHSPLLCDKIDEALDKVTDRPVKSLKVKNSGGGGEQLTLF